MNGWMNEWMNLILCSSFQHFHLCRRHITLPTRMYVWMNDYIRNERMNGWKMSKWINGHFCSSFRHFHLCRRHTILPTRMYVSINDCVWNERMYEWMMNECSSSRIHRFSIFPFVESIHHVSQRQTEYQD